MVTTYWSAASLVTSLHNSITHTKFSTDCSKNNLYVFLSAVLWFFKDWLNCIILHKAQHDSTCFLALSIGVFFSHHTLMVFWLVFSRCMFFFFFILFLTNLCLCFKIFVDSMSLNMNFKFNSFTKYHVAHAGLKFTMYMRMALNSWSSCIYLPSVSISRVRYHTWI